eukprot:TRINITY_DN3944_c0_g2_i1.p1 TRINITY_DN3944_c0_g2~~TRINITY_DN3944_c0_g2_i1.p1  ORF type:complete len:152 (+),score=7.11 TRINITY_DN3944_c0_g2_i1:308-763(+)
MLPPKLIQTQSIACKHYLINFSKQIHEKMGTQFQNMMSKQNINVTHILHVQEMPHQQKQQCYKQRKTSLIFQKSNKTIFFVGFFLTFMSYCKNLENWQSVQQIFNLEIFPIAQKNLFLDFQNALTFATKKISVVATSSSIKNAFQKFATSP